MIGERPFPKRTRAIGKRIITNGFPLIIPILIWNLLFWAKLPEDSFEDDILEESSGKLLVSY